MDIMYFEDSTEYQEEFMRDIKEAFPDIELRDAYDSIKGYRQEVHYPDELETEYLAWLVGNGWLEMSLTMQIIMRDEGQRERFDKAWSLAKEKYPEAFKKEA